MHARSFFFIIILSTITTFAQINPGAKQVSLSNSDAATSSDVFAIFNNPAGLSRIKWKEVGIYYSPDPYGLSELANVYAAYSMPFTFGSIGIGVMTYGFELYRENKFSLAYSYNFENKFQVGITLNWYSVVIKNYGHASTLFLDAGGIFYLTELIRMGFHFGNLNRASLGGENDQIPVIYNSGFSFDATKDITLHLSMEKDLIHNASIKFGFDYNIIKYFSIRTGFANEPSKYSAGIGINYSGFHFNYAIYTHQELGITHQFDIIYFLDSNIPNPVN